MVLENIQEKLERGIIEHSQSPWNSSIFVVSKPGGGSRLVVDYRKLNEKAVEMLHVGHDIQDLILQVGRKQADVFSTFDVLKGFWQIRLTPESRKYTSFSIPGYGSFQYTRTPMGLASRASQFF